MTTSVKLIGIQHNPIFQQCVEAAEYMQKEHNYQVDIVRNFEYQLDRERRQLVSSQIFRGDAEVMLKENVIAFISAPILLHANNNNSEEEEQNQQQQPRENVMLTGPAFLKRVVSNSDFQLFNLPSEHPESYQSLARLQHRRYLRSTGCAFAWMLIKQGDVPLGRLTFQLFADKAPRTCQNFLYLCRGDLPDVETEEFGKVKLSYKGSRVFRVLKNGWIQAGDIVEPKKGNNGYSIYGRHFPDEAFEIPHEDEGIVGMANDGEHTNASSFYITTQKASWMNKRYVSFARVVEGLGVLRALRDVQTKHNQSPVDDIVIDDCGEISTDP